MASPSYTRSWRGRLAVVAIPAIAAGVVALVLSSMSTERYRASADVVVDTATVPIATAIEVAEGSIVLRGVAPFVGDEPEFELSTAGADQVVRITATSADAIAAARAANIYAAVLTESLPGTTLTDEAIPPSDPFEPTPLRTSLVAAAVGAVIGLAAAIVTTLRNTTIRSPRQLVKMTGRANLAVIPRPPLGVRRPEEVAMLRDPDSIEAEAYRTLLAGLDVLRRELDASVLLVTSPRPREGKSSVSANLAAAAAAAGQRVVLIDADMRQPNVHRDYHLGNGSGLSSVLKAEAVLADAVERPPATTNLMVMPAGPPPPDPAELLSSARLGKVVEAVAAASDLVIIDSPPVLPVADALLLAQHADAVLLTATVDVSDRREWSETLARLGLIRATILGTVLSRPDDRVNPVGAYRYAPTPQPPSDSPSSGGTAATTPGASDATTPVSTPDRRSTWLPPASGVGGSSAVSGMAPPGGAPSGNTNDENPAP